MLTIEMLRANSTLAGLTDAQLASIAEMSKNDENAVIGTKIGELHGKYDADILGITGIAKNGTEKSYDYTKRVLNEYKTQITKLTKQIADGNVDEATKQQLKDAKNQVVQLQKQLETKEAEYKTKEAEAQKQIKNVHVDYAFSTAASGLKFKDSITEGVQKVLLSAAKAEILAKGTPDFIDDGKGGKTLIFRSADGNVLNNPNNNLNPYTVKELLLESSVKDVIDTGKQQPGGGTVPPAGGTKQTGTVLDLSSAKNQIDADKIIEAHLLANGLTRDSAQFAEQSLQLRADNKVNELPIR